MATLEQISAALVQAHAAGNVEHATALSNAIRQIWDATSAIDPPEVPGPQVISEETAAASRPAALVRPMRRTFTPAPEADRIRGGSVMEDYLRAQGGRAYPVIPERTESALPPRLPAPGGVAVDESGVYRGATVVSRLPEIERKYNLATPAQREAMAAGTGYEATVARALNEQYATRPQQLSRSRRVEDRAAEIAGRTGAAPNVAYNAAVVGEMLGTPTGEEVSGTITPSELPFETAEEFRGESPITRGAAKGVSGLKASAYGGMQTIGDALVGIGEAAGMEPLINVGAQLARGAAEGRKETDLYQQAIGSRGVPAARFLEEAVAGAVRNVPGLLTGVVSGSAKLALSTMAADVFGDTYAEGRERGLTPGDAAKRAGSLTIAEILGESLGIGSAIKTLRAATKIDPLLDPIKEFSKYVAKEVPGEQLTNILGFDVEKSAEFGLSPQATNEDLLNSMVDTFIQTVGQTAVLGAGAGAINVAARQFGPRRPMPAERTVERPPLRDIAAEVPPPAVSPAAPVVPPGAAPAAPPVAPKVAAPVEAPVAEPVAEAAEPVAEAVPEVTPAARAEQVPLLPGILSREMLVPEEGELPFAEEPKLIEEPAVPEAVTTEKGSITPVQPPEPATIAEPAASPIPLKTEGITGFQTSKGSTYTLTEDGKTIRTKRSPGRGQGTTYDPHPVLYVTPENITNIQNEMASGMGSSSVRLGYVDKQNNTFVLAKEINKIPKGADIVVAVVNKKTNALQGIYPAVATPEIGLHPVEKLYAKNGMAYTHLGNKIVKLTSSAEAPRAEPIEGAGGAGVPPAVQPGPEVREPTGAPGVGAPERGRVAVGERPAGEPVEGAPAQPAALEKPIVTELPSIERAPTKSVERAGQIRDEQIQEYAKLRRAIGLVPKKVAEGKADLGLQKKVGDMLQSSRELQAAIRDTKPRQDSPQDFLARALKEYSAGNISPEVLGVVQDLYTKSPDLLDGLLLSVRKPAEEGVGGTFAPLNRLVTLFKETSGVEDPTTIRHEITHTLEQMMTPEQRAAVVQAWTKAVTRAMRQNPDDLHQKYFQAVKKFIEAPTLQNMKEAQALIPSYDMYQYLNPSEYWAVNAEPLLKAKLGTGWDRFKNSVRGLFESLKKIVGFNNKSDVYKTFSQVMGGGKERLSRDTLIDYVKKSEETFPTLENRQFAKQILDKYKRPNTPLRDLTPMRTAITKNYIAAKEAFKDYVKNPSQIPKDAGSLLGQGLLRLRNEMTFYGGYLESSDFDRYGGQLKTSSDLFVASVAVDNALRASNIATQVVLRGGIEFNKNIGNWVAVNRDKGMLGVFDAERSIQDKIGQQEGTDLTQGYLEARRSIDVINASNNRKAELKQARSALAALKKSKATPQAIAQAQGVVKAKEAAVDRMNNAVSSVYMTEDERKEFAAADQKFSELKTLLDNWRAVKENLLKAKRQVGLISKETYDSQMDMLDYVPWQRIMDESENVYSSLNINPPSKSLVNIAQDKLFKKGAPVAYVEFEAKAGQKDFDVSYYLIRGRGPKPNPEVTVNGQKVDPKFITESPSGKVILNVPLNDQDRVSFKTHREIQNIVDNMMDSVIRQTISIIQQYAATRIVTEYATRDKNNNVIIFNEADRSKNRIPAIIDGEKMIVEIKDSMIAQAMYGVENAINLKMYPVVLQATNLFRRSITLDPGFQAAQLMQDAQTAAFVSGIKNPIPLVGGVIKNFYATLRANDPIVDLLQSAGIGVFYSPARDAQKEVNLRLGVKNKDTFDSVLRLLDHISDASDMAPRAAVYKRIMAETNNEGLAIFQAANAPANWNRVGASKIAQFFTRLVPFWNAATNWIDKLVFQLFYGKNLTDKTRKENYQQLLLMTTYFSLTTIIYRFLVGDDPEYKKLDDQTKLRNYIVPGTSIMIPMNQGPAYFFKAVPEMLFNSIVEQGTKDAVDARRLKTALQEGFLQATLPPLPVPAVAKPILEIALDKNFFTKENLIPKNLKDKVEAEQYTAATSELAKLFSSLTATDSKGNRLLSPIEVDHLMRGFLGTAAMAANWFVNSVVAHGERVAPEARETPVIGRFIRPDVPRGKEDLFYDFKDDVTKAYETWKLKIARGKIDEANEFFEENRKLIVAYDYIKKSQEKLDKLNAEIRRLGESVKTGLTPEERRERINRMRQIKQQTLEQVNRIRVQTYGGYEKAAESIPGIKALTEAFSD